MFINENYTKIIYLYKKITSIVSSNIREKQLLNEVHKSKLFKFGLVIRLLLIIFCIPHIQKIWFLEFINNSLESLSFNPWQAHLNAGGDIKAFPYGYIMYLFYLPLTTLGWLFDKLLNLEYFSRFGFAITTLIFDYGILMGIIRLLKNYSSKLILLAYWCSPVIFYIFYWHGQIDALPVFFLIYGLSLLQKEKTNLAGIFLGLAISSKFSMLAAIPFIFIYLIRNKRLKNKLNILFASIFITYFFSILPFIKSSSFQSMVLKNSETEKLFSVFISYGYDLNLFLLPTVYFLSLYLVWRLERINLDLFLISIGLGFFSVLLFLPPSPGWFAWIMPFLVYYQLRSKDQYLISTLPFFLIYLTYNLLYSTGADITFFNIPTDLPLEKLFGLNNSRLKSILFTGLQATGLIVCTRMYLFGIVRNNYYRGFGDKLAIGISGFIPDYINDILKSFENLFGPRSISFLEVSDYKRSDNNNHLQASKSFLNPNSYNLSRLTKDLYLLADGKSICQNIDNSRRKIDSHDFIFINGIHSLTVKRLRQRLDLKIFFEIDQELHDYFFKKNNHSIYSFKSKSEKKEFNNYQESQFKYSDLSFKISPVNSNLLKRKEEIVIPKLKLFVKMANGFFHEELIRSLISLCGMYVDVEQTSFSDDVYLCIEGEATKEDIAQIANILIPNLEDLLICNPSWENGYRGLIQLIILVHISNLLYRSSSSKNYV